MNTSSVNSDRVRFYESAIRYRYGEGTTAELGESLVQYLINAVRSPSMTKAEAIRLILTDISWAFGISAATGSRCVLLLAHQSALKLKNRLLEEITEYARFVFMFQRTIARLKTAEQKNNILCIVPWLKTGGAERVMLNIARSADKKGTAFHIMTTYPAAHEWQEEFRPHFQNIIIPVRRRMSAFIWKKYLHQAIKKLRIDAVIITASHDAYKYLPKLRAAFDGVRTMDILHFDSKSRTMDLMLVDPHPYLDRRVCISHNLRELMIKKYARAGISPEYANRLLVVHNGIDIKAYSPNGRMRGAFRSRYGIPADSKVISFVGRFVDQKKPLLFVEIALAVLRKLPGTKIHFIMAGDGPEFDNVRAAVDRQGLADHITLTGSLSNVPDLLAETDLLLVTSAYEGIPLAVTEAMAMNVPVISTDVDAVGELIENNRNGFLITPDDNVIGSFTAKIADLLTGKGDHRAITDRARKTVSGEYSLEAMGARYQKIFDDLLSVRTS